MIRVYIYDDYDNFSEIVDLTEEQYKVFEWLDNRGYWRNFTTEPNIAIIE